MSVLWVRFVWVDRNFSGYPELAWSPCFFFFQVTLNWFGALGVWIWIWILFLQPPRKNREATGLQRRLEGSGVGTHFRGLANGANQAKVQTPGKTAFSPNSWKLRGSFQEKFKRRVPGSLAGDTTWASVFFESKAGTDFET